MNVQHRPSILHRPARAPGKANVESAEAQYEREQALIHAKSQRQADAHDRLHRSLYPTPDDKAAAYQELVRSNELLMQQPQQQHAMERPGTAGGARQEQAQRTLRPDERPWHSSTTTLHYSHDEEDAARRRFAAEVAEENLRLMYAKQATSVRQAADEQESRRSVLAEDNWFNRGAPAPPARAAAGARPAGAGGGDGVRRAPWATTDDAAAQAMAQAPTGTLAPKEYPWTWRQ